MNKRFLTAALKSTAIVLMLLSAFAIAFPLMHFINGKLYQLENYALTELQNKTGLTVSYESLSPAILNGLNFKGITITDSESDTILLHTGSVKIGYRLWPLLHGKIAESIKNITISGLDVHFNDEQNMKAVERIISLINENSDDSSEKTEGFRIPFPITLKDCSFAAEVRGMSGRLTLDAITLKSSSSAPYTTNIETKGNLTFIPDDTLTPIIPQLTTDLNIQAVLTPDLNGTFGRFELKKTDGGVFSFNDVEFAAGLEGKTLSLSVFTPDAPYGVEAWWNMETGAVQVELNATDFDPFTVISLNKKHQILKKVKDARIDGRFTIKGKLPEAGQKLPDFTYDVDGAVYLPPGILENELAVSLAATGDLTYVSVSDLQVETEPFSLNYYGDVDVSRMSLDGYLKLGHYILPSGKLLEGEFYLDGLEPGFSAFAPQVIVGDSVLNAVQLTCIPDSSSADIILEALDSQNNDEPGTIALSGSVLYGTERFLQASLSFENERIENIVRYVENVLPLEKEIDPSLYEKLSPYLISCDVYGSSDFTSFAFNVPYAVIASTQKNGPMLLLSLDGNETNLQVSQFELVYGGQQLTASISADSNEDYSQIFFSTDFMYNEVPYYFSGVYDKGREIVLNGDYDFELRSDLRVKNEILCSLYVDTIPVKLKDYMLSLSLDTEVDFTNLENFFITMNRFEITENSGRFRSEPRVELSGFADRYGLLLETLNYGDSVSILTGNGSASWGISKLGLESLDCDISLENNIGNEQVMLNVSAFSDAPVQLSDKNILQEFYVSGNVEVNSLLMSHLLENQTMEDRVSVSASLLGQLSNPSVTLSVNEMQMHAAGFPVNASALFNLDDKTLSGTDINCTYRTLAAEQFNFMYSVDGKAGSGTGVVGVYPDETMYVQSEVSFSLAIGESEEDQQKKLDLKKLPYTVKLTFEDVQSNYDFEIKEYPIEINHFEGMWGLSAGPTGGITGSLLDTGDFYVGVVADFPVQLSAAGNLGGGMLDIQADDIHGDVSFLKYFLKNDSFSIDDGKFEGNLKLGGKFLDPDFAGEITVSDFTLMLPDYINDPLIAPVITLVAEDTVFAARNTLFNIGKSQVLANLTIEMDGWGLQEIDMNIQSINKTLVPAHFNISYADCSADVDLNAHLNITGKDMAITGSVSLYNGLVELHAGASDDEDEKQGDTGGRVYIDMNISMNQKAELYYPDKDNPLIRGLVTTQEPVRLIMDSDTADISLKGSLALRGGEILYLNRNFYIREGSLELNENGDSFDPRISFRAEIRERDAEGETVKINLSADRQKLSELSPVLSSQPSKTEDELRLMLGAALVAESGSTPGEVLATVAASGFDFLLQNSMFRSLENRLRDLLKFDIFSFRTPFIQQALLSAMNNTEEPTSLGNFLDNTTVYIGKYIGNTIYLDALLRFVYQNDSSGRNDGRLVFQPEVGLELPSPFATIRWSIAPDITSAKNLWVPYTSISLSWSFKF